MGMRSVSTNSIILGTNKTVLHFFQIFYNLLICFCLFSLFISFVRSLWKLLCKNIFFQSLFKKQFKLYLFQFGNICITFLIFFISFLFLSILFILRYFIYFDVPVVTQIAVQQCDTREQSSNSSRAPYILRLVIFLLFFISSYKSFFSCEYHQIGVHYPQIQEERWVIPITHSPNEQCQERM